MTALDESGLVRVQPVGRGAVDIEVLPRLDLSATAALTLAEDLRRRQRRSTPPTIIAVDRFRPEMRRSLIEAGLSWAERATDYLHVNAPGLYIHDEGDTGSASRGAAPDGGHGGRAGVAEPYRPTRLRGLSGRCAETLLLWWRASDVRHCDALISPTDLARWSDVSTPMAAHVLHRLESLGALAAERTRSRTRGWRVRAPERILDSWTDEEVAQPAVETLAYVWARSPRELMQRLVRLHEHLRVWAVGGVAAGNLYVPTLTAEPALTVWVPEHEPAERAVAALDGTVVTEGANVTLRQVPKDPWALNRLVLDAAELGGPATDGPRSPTPDAHGLAAWRRASLPVPGADRWRGLSLVSRPRAAVEAARDGRGRAAEVAEAVRRSLALEPAPV